MGNDQNFTNEDEVLILVDEDGNEIPVTEEVEEYLNSEVQEVVMEEEYELEDSFEPEPFEEDEPVYETKAIDFDEEENPGEGLLAGTANKMLLLLGAVIFVIAIAVLGILFFSKRAPKDTGVDFAGIGKEVAALGIIGENGIHAVATAEGERLDVLYEAQKNYDYDEADQQGGISSINLALTSILKDLKIKVENSKGKLIGNVPFELEVTGPDGKTVIWEDDDKDGIIYKTDLAGGTYKVKIVPLNGYDSMYDFSTCSVQSVSVKTQLDYKKVDVKNEIKNSSQVDKSEDAAANETEVESVLKDTVAYVMSSKTASSNGFGPIDKSKITDPMKALEKKNEASIGRFKRLSAPVNTEGENPDPSGTEPDPGNEPDPGTSGNNPPTPPEEHAGVGDWIWGEDQHWHVCKVEGCTDKCDLASCSYDYTNPVSKGTTENQKHKVKCSVCGHEKEEACVDADKDGKCDKCLGVIASSSAAIKSFEGTVLYSLADTAKTKGKIKVVYDIFPVPDVISFAWTSNNDCVVLSDADKQEVSVEAKKSGKAVLTCKITYTDKLSGNSIVLENPTVEVTVEGGTLSLDREAKKAIFVDGDKFTLKAVSKGGKTNLVKWSVSDASIAKLEPAAPTGNDSEKVTACVISGLKEGTVTVTCTSEDDAKLVKQIVIVVVKNPKTDRETKLIADDGKQVYVYNSSSKSYVEATYADYYSGVDLFIPEEVTYKYTGWWTIDGKTYYYDANGKKVTGDQVILGAKYSFDSNGVLKSGTGLFGIDVSTWNGTIDWNKVAKSGVSYAIIRCGFRGTTVGGLVEDNKFASNVKNATDAGIKVGIYFFTQAISEAEAVEEASMCLSLVEGKKITYPIFIDVESATNGRANGLSKDARTAIVKAFCKTIANSGYKAGVYANKNWFTNYLNTSELTGYSIWLAQYAASPTYTATRYDLWQYTNKGSISGISGDVDLDLNYLGY